MTKLVWILVIVIDGLRPDFVTPTQMPRLSALGDRGVVFSAHHSVFPTVTRVNASTLVTGVYPETHGLLGNTIYVPAANATRGLDTGSRENLEAVARADGPLLTAPTLAEILQRGGKALFATGSGTSGAAFLLNPTIANGAIVHQDFTRPESFGAHVLEVLGSAPKSGMPNAEQNRRAVDAYLKLGLDELHPDVTLMWISDPDHTAHSKGLGTPETIEALKLADAEIGRIEDALRQRGVLDRTNIIVTSDHGFSTHTGAMNVNDIVTPFAKTLPDGSRDIVVAEGSINFRGGPADPARVSAIVAELQRRPEVGAIFTRSPVPGALSLDVARANHRRAGEILVSANWSREKNDTGIEGKTGNSGAAGHGTTSPYDVHNTLIAAGPGFREHAVSGTPTGTVDLAPTILRLLGLDVPASMSGRVIQEGLRGATQSPRADHRVESASNADRSYQVDAHLSIVGKYRYLDFTEVKRR